MTALGFATVALRWQATTPDGIAHAYVSLRPGTAPVCEMGPDATHERWEYPERARCVKCLAIESRPLLRRMGRV
jgi:hypothetical protein